MTDAWIVFF